MFNEVTLDLEGDPYILKKVRFLDIPAGGFVWDVRAHDRKGAVLKITFNTDGGYQQVVRMEVEKLGDCHVVEEGDEGDDNMYVLKIPDDGWMGCIVCLEYGN